MHSIGLACGFTLRDAMHRLWHVIAFVAFFAVAATQGALVHDVAAAGDTTKMLDVLETVDVNTQDEQVRCCGVVGSRRPS